MASDFDTINIMFAADGAEEAAEKIDKVGNAAVLSRRNIMTAERSMFTFNRALKDLSSSGTLSTQSMMGLATLLPRLATPAGALSVAIGAVAGAALAAKDAFDKVMRQDIDAMLRKQAEAAGVAAKGWDAYWKAIIDGSDKAGARLAQHAAEANATFENARADVVAQVKDFQDKIAKLTEENAQRQEELQSGHAILFGLQMPGRLRGAGITGAQEEIEANKQLIASYARSIDQLQRSLSGEAHAARDATVADKEHADAMKKAQPAFLSNIPGGTDVMPQAAASFLHTLTNDVGNAAAVITQAQAMIAESASQMIGGVAVQAYDNYVAALNRAIFAQEFSVHSLTKALKTTLKTTLMTVGEEAAVKSVMEGAAAVASAAARDAQGAAQHSVASATYASVAAMAGVGAAVLGGRAGMGGGPVAGSSGPGGDTSSGQAPVNQYVTVIGSLDARDAENLNAQLAAARSSRNLA